MVVINRLKNLQIRNATGPTRLQDGGGLSLRVRKGGSKAWVFTYRWNDKRPEVGLGAWPTVTLAMARDKAEQARAWLAATPKRDPRIEWERIAKADRADSTAILFGEFAEAYIRDRAQGWKHPDHERQWRGSLKRHAKDIWDTPINDVSSSHILNCLKPIWYQIPTTAKRVLGRLELIFDAARAEGYVDGNNPAIWRGKTSRFISANEPSTHQGLSAHTAGLTRPVAINRISHRILSPLLHAQAQAMA